jgi:hypothetical protein
VAAAGGCDAGGAAELEDCDGKVPERGHDLGSVAGPGLGGVFAVGDVADVVQASMCQWPRIHSASWAAVAWLAVRLVTA